MVRRLIESARFRLRALLVTDTALDALAGDLQAADRDLTVFVATRSVLRQIGGYDFHQGCLGLAARPARPSLSDLIDHAGSGPPIVVLERVGNPDNVGGVFRNAAAFGAAAIVVGPGCADPLYRKAIRTSLGAVLHTPFTRQDAWPAGLHAIKAAGYQLAALTPHPDAIDLVRHRPDRHARGTALLLGNEGDGLSPEALAVADVRIRIPVDPPVDSLNVATTAGIALHQLRVGTEA